VAGALIDEEEGVLEHHISHLLGRKLLSHLKMEVTVEGSENVEGLERYAVVSTHASYLDWAVLLGYFPLPVRFIAKRELIWIPVIGSFLKTRGILIDRKRGVDAKEAIRRATRVAQPWPILIFPEGTRSPDGKVHPFKRGGLRILVDAGLSLVPVCIQGTFDAFPRHATAIKTGCKLLMKVGQPVLPPDPPDREWMMAEVERRVRALAGAG
jgi:1-acyl-sn-glycerol-3-phosphate acyltransferase